MTEQLLNKANQLKINIDRIEDIIEEYEVKHHWINIITSTSKDHYISDRLEEELVDWLKNKVIEYKKEFDELA